MFTLAGYLKKTVGEIMDTMSALEFAEWVALHRISPIGEWREDFQSAVIAQTIANVNRGSGVKPFKPSDFMLRLPQTDAEQALRDKREANARRLDELKADVARRARETT